MPYFESVSVGKILQCGFSKGITDKLVLGYILRNVLIAIDRIHSSSSVLKALKPNKVLIGRDGSIKVLDCDISANFRGEMCKKGFVGPH